MIVHALRLLRTVNLCDVSVRGALLGNVVLVGGGTQLPGFAARLESSVRDALEQAKVKWRVRVVARGDRRLAVWLGGATLGATATGRSHFVGREQVRASEGALRPAWSVLGACAVGELERRHARHAAAVESDGRAAAAHEAAVGAAAGASFWRSLVPRGSEEERRRQR